uniref:KIF21A/B second helical domain-containing protein n=1 Tax=Romanomermis culicivorax TaxID=13658 RepID=A0A915HQA7_ROMCU
MPQLIDLNDQIENVKAKLDYVQDMISECQSQIISVDESKEESDENSNNSTAICTNLDEANFLIENLIDICVTNLRIDKILVAQVFVSHLQGARCGQSESKARDLEIQLQQVQNDYTLNEKLLKHLIGFKPNDPAIQDAITASETDKHADVASDVNLINDRSLTNSTAEIPLHRCPSVKARRRTATPKELLFSDATTVIPMRQLLSDLKEGETPPSVIPSQSPDVDTRNFFFDLDYSKMLPRRANSFVEQENKAVDKSSRKMLQFFEDGDHLTIASVDSDMSRSYTFSRNSPYRSTVALASGLSKENKPEKIMSPRLMRRQLDGKDVFSRLTASTTDVNESDIDDVDGSHVMEPYSANDKPPIKNAPLLCTHVVHGHSKDVLSLAATDDFLFTGSKGIYIQDFIEHFQILQILLSAFFIDKTVCIWDLEKCKKFALLSNHSSSVNCLRYSASKRILFSVSMSQVILWDIRSNKRIKIFNSSGLTSDSDTNFDDQSSQSILQPGETPINQIELSDYFNEMLFTSVYNQIRVWDLRNFQAIGKLASATYNQRSEIWSLSLFHRKDGIRLATGGRDHYIKMVPGRYRYRTHHYLRHDCRYLESTRRFDLISFENAEEQHNYEDYQQQQGRSSI